MSRDDRQGGERRRIEGWSLERIAAATGGRICGADAAQDRTPRSVCSDTRKLEAGELFVALRGARFDGHDFLDEALEAGAVAALVDDESALPEGLAGVVVDDTLDGLTELGHAVWEEAQSEGLHTIDVTGSNGKTTVKEMLAALWGARGAVFATPGNLNNHIGVPLVLCDLPVDCEHLVLEMGANAPGEIAHLVSLAPGSERIVTSIGTAHVEGFGSVDGIRRAKSEIFEKADDETTAVVPHREVENLIDDDFPGRVVTVGFEPDADLRVESRDASREHAQVVQIEGAGGEWTIGLPLPGAHNALNVATSLATLIVRGSAPDGRTCTEVLADLTLPAGRWRETTVGPWRVLDDAYNANPSSIRASFDAFMKTDDALDRPRVAVIGYMAELGDEAERYHREVAVDLAGASGLDALVAVGRHAESMADAARRAAPPDGPEVVAFERAEAAARWLEGQGEGFVFLKASREARLERVVDFLTADGED
ncbi:MAG: UDP-N-acetylmuramoyl-tripeptide--D-alanyl-D-alanine ligase [Persicimonas sp.]